MPIPSPQKNEKVKDFISRCMSDSAMTKDYENNQRYAICQSTWEKANQKQNSSANILELDMSENLPKAKFAKADLQDGDGPETEDYTPSSPSEGILSTMLQMQSQYRIFHWQTKSYSEHKAFGKIYEVLDENIDDFIEAYMGKYGRMVSSEEIEIEMLNYKDNISCCSVTDSYINFLVNVLPMALKPEDTDLINIRDTILGDLNQLKYLLTLS